ncbi:MAG: erythromycin esterase family protein [Myxococcales bacterium]|nr:erythromycin esterase family protein [Myxococcales bacterium]
MTTLWMWLWACTPKPPSHLVGAAGQEALIEAAVATGAVGLGESFHGSGAIAQARVELTKRLLERGFRVVAIEAPWTGGEAIDAWLQRGCAPERATTMVGRLSHAAWQDVSTVELLQWMCAYNLEHPDAPVHVLGFDTQDIAAIEQVADAIEAPRTRIVPACLRRDAPVSAICLEAVSDPRAPEAARIATRARAEQEAVHSSAVATHNARDAGMAELFTHLLPSVQGPLVIWAHNTHLNEASDVTRTCGKGWARSICRNRGLVRMGTLLADVIDIHTVAISGRQLQLYKPGGATTWTARRSSAEAALPDGAYVPLHEPWVATLGRSHVDLGDAFDAVLTVAPGRPLTLATP